MFALTQAKDIVFLFSALTYIPLSALPRTCALVTGADQPCRKKIWIWNTRFGHGLPMTCTVITKKQLTFAKPRTVAKIIVAKVAVDDMHRHQDKKVSLCEAKGWCKSTKAHVNCDSDELSRTCIVFKNKKMEFSAAKGVRLIAMGLALLATEGRCWSRLWISYTSTISIRGYPIQISKYLITQCFDFMIHVYQATSGHGWPRKSFQKVLPITKGDANDIPEE